MPHIHKPVTRYLEIEVERSFAQIIAANELVDGLERVCYVHNVQCAVNINLIVCIQFQKVFQILTCEIWKLIGINFIESIILV